MAFSWLLECVMLIIMRSRLRRRRCAILIFELKLALLSEPRASRRMGRYLYLFALACTSLCWLRVHNSEVRPRGDRTKLPCGHAATQLVRSSLRSRKVLHR